MDFFPPGFIALIIENAPDVDSLWSVIRTSPYIYYVYLPRQEKMPPIVIYCDVSHVLISEAFAVPENQEELGEDIGNPVPVDWISSELLPRTDALRWAEKYLPGSEKEKWAENYTMSDMTSILTPLDNTQSLWGIFNDVTFMAGRYVHESLPQVNSFAGDVL